MIGEIVEGVVLEFVDRVVSSKVVYFRVFGSPIAHRSVGAPAAQLVVVGSC